MMKTSHPGGGPPIGPLPYFADWPRIESPWPAAPEADAEVRRLLGLMTPEEKVGQMIQPEVAQLTPEEAGRYKFGSALNGAGIFPGGDHRATAQDWVRMVDAYWCAVDAAFAGRPFRIPFLWATDAVHGHGNAHGATIFPHNIGLGATRDPDLIRRIGAATAREVAATGMDWTFAPTVTTPRDRRWGRYYEGYSEDPEVVSVLAAAMVEGLQGMAAEGGPAADDKVTACIKHWLADGGTRDGADRGDCWSDEEILRNIHAAGYFSGLAAGAQSVMVSFSGWHHPSNYDHAPEEPGGPYNFKLAGSRHLIRDVLKAKLGFDGVVITDWDAHSEVSRCDLGQARYVINAGVDLLMVAARSSWTSIHERTVADIASGAIPAARIDDAVGRILRMKMRAGLWDKPRPMHRTLAGDATRLGTAESRALSREAARKSLVLLKNDGGLLPLRRDARVLVAGSGANDIRKQAGGWTRSWQGGDVTPDDLPGARTLAMAIRDVVGPDRCLVDPNPDRPVPPVDVAIVAIGEDAYAEMRGTIRPWRPIAYADLKTSYRRDLEILRALHRSGIPIVTVFFSGRPLYVNEEINLSGAFVAAWLPGPEGAGLTDLLFRAADGAAAHDFTGRLGFSWPATPFSYAANRIPPHIPNFRVPAEEQAPTGLHTPPFPFGYGLTFADAGAKPGQLALFQPGFDPPPSPACEPMEIPIASPDRGFRWVHGGHHTWSGEPIDFERPRQYLVMDTTPVAGPDGGAGLTVRFKGDVSFLYARHADGRPRDRRGYLGAGASLAFDARLLEPFAGSVYLACHDDFPSQPGLDITARLHAIGADRWCRIEVPIDDLAATGMDFRHVDAPFMLYSEATGALAIAGLSWNPPLAGNPGVDDI